jgi:hypothetical protein
MFFSGDVTVVFPQRSALPAEPATMVGAFLLMSPLLERNLRKTRQKPQRITVANSDFR